MYTLLVPVDVQMTRVVVIGDSGTGKTAFMMLASGQSLPYNVFRSTHVETFFMCNATFYVVPGTTDISALQETCDGADGIIVICKRGGSAQARAWLQAIERIANDDIHVPIIICAHGNTNVRKMGEDGVRMLRRYRNSEYAFTCNAWPEGIQDCANRIVHRIRRAPTTPVRCYAGQSY